MGNIGCFWYDNNHQFQKMELPKEICW